MKEIELQSLRTILEVQQSEIEILKSLREVQKRQINTLMWAYGILAAFNFLAVIVFMGW